MVDKYPTADPQNYWRDPTSYPRYRPGTSQGQAWYDYRPQRLEAFDPSQAFGNRAVNGLLQGAGIPPLPYLGLARAAVGMTATALERVDRAISKAFSEVGREITASAYAAFQDQKVIYGFHPSKTLWRDAKGGGPNPLDTLLKKLFGENPLRKGELVPTGERAPFLKGRIGSMLPGLDPRVFGMFVLADLYGEWLLGGLSVSAGTTFAWNPNGWPLYREFGPCNLPGSYHPAGVPYPDYSRQRQGIAGANGFFVHDVAPILDVPPSPFYPFAVHYVGSWIPGPYYPATYHDAYAAYGPGFDAEGNRLYPQDPVLEVKRAPRGIMFPWPDPFDFPKGFYWNPWPALAPMNDPRTAPGGLPLNLAGRAIPWSMIPYRPSAPVSNGEYSQRGPVPSERSVTPPTWPAVVMEVPLGGRGAPPGGGLVENVPGMGLPAPVRGKEKKPDPKSVFKRIAAGKLDRHVARALVSKAFSATTEFADVVDCAYQAIPKSSRLPYRPGKAITLDEKTVHAAKQLAAGNFDGGAFISCVAQNHYQDMMIGKLNAQAETFKRIDKNLPPAFWMPSGYGVR